MFIVILGRQPALGMAELERTHGAGAVAWFSDSSATISAGDFNISRFGGAQKAGTVELELTGRDWHAVSQKIIQTYSRELAGAEGKVTLGISAYGFDASPREIQKTGIILKQKLKAGGVSLRLVPNPEQALSSAASHHNKLGLADSKIELLVVRGQAGKIIVARSTGAQNITAYARRDQQRPRRDAFVGMLPPKLAQIMINLAVGRAPEAPTILDPFCGTGTVLQEAMLMGYNAYGTDLSEKMIRYSRDNLNWLQDKFQVRAEWYLHPGDAMETTWRQPISAVVSETYLGQPFSASPAPDKLAAVRRNCDHIIASFLKNIARQLAPGTPLCLAVPAWRGADGRFTHLQLTSDLKRLGFRRAELTHVPAAGLLYYREGQIVARELLILEKIQKDP